MVIAAVLLAMPVMGQGNRIYIEDFVVEPDSTITVPVMVANADSTRGLQFNLALPDGLTFEKCVVSAYSRKCEMTMTCQYDQAKNFYLVLVYPMGRICFPAAVEGVALLTLTARSDFRGGDIAIWKCFGSSVDNKTIAIDGGTTKVTVPENILFGVPIDQKADQDQFFNLLDAPADSQ